MQIGKASWRAVHRDRRRSSELEMSMFDARVINAALSDERFARSDYQSAICNLQSAMFVWFA